MKKQRIYEIMFLITRPVAKECVAYEIATQNIPGQIIVTSRRQWSLVRPWARPGRCCLRCRLPWSISSVQSLDQDVSKVSCFLFLLPLGEESSPTLLDLLFSVNNLGGIFSNQIYEQKMSTKKTAMQTASCNHMAAQFGT